MKIHFPKNTESTPARRQRALTILEMLVSTALLAVIILGLTAMFVQTQKAFKMGIKQSDVTDAGRSIIDMMAGDLQQLSDPHFVNPNAALVPNLYWQWVPSSDLVQMENGTVFRINQVDDVFAMLQTNATWLGVGYYVSNWFSQNGSAVPGVGTLYRYTAQVNSPIYTNNTLFSDFENGVSLSSGGQNATGTITTNFHRLADGVVHLKIYAYNGNGNEDIYELPYDKPGVVGVGSVPLYYPESELSTAVFPPVLVTNDLPRSLDIELGILEPDTFEQVRALFASGATAAAQQLLVNSSSKVQVFRQHIVIPAASSPFPAFP